MLEVALSSDGTPFVEISDEDIEAGELMSGGKPKYPILFSLAAECISDAAVSKIESFVSAGGIVYVGSSSWTKRPDGSARTDFALSAQMGVKCVNVPPNNWVTVGTAIRIASNHRLVNHVPKDVSINWRLPLTYNTTRPWTCHYHYAWATRVTDNEPAEVLMTIGGYVMLATKAYSKGRFIYHCELAPLAGYAENAVDMYEYVFFRKAIEWAFDTHGIPLARLSPWKYQYNSAFVVRHDMDNSHSSVNWIVSSAQTEKALGVTGQYYIVTGEVRDSANYEALVAYLQQAKDLGAEIGSHNGGLNSTIWSGAQPGQYDFYHWGPDVAMLYHPSGREAGKDYANMSIKKSLDDLEGWLGERPVIWVSPYGDSCFDESFQIFESNNIKTSGDLNIGPYPYFAFSFKTKGKIYDNLVIPTTEWITSSGSMHQSLDSYSTTDVTDMLNFLYSLGALVSPYTHTSSSGGICYVYITQCLAKPYIWNATPIILYNWWKERQQVSINPIYQRYSSWDHNITVTLSGSISPDIALDIIFPSMSRFYDVKVQVDGVPSNDFREITGGIKVKVGLASKVTVTYKAMTIESWTQTSREDFESGTLTDLDTSTVPGQVLLAIQSGGEPTVLLHDDFNDASWTNANWTVQSGNWKVENGLYIETSSSATCPLTYYKWGTSWTDYIFEAKTRWAGGDYGAEIGARLNTTTGARYAFWVYPNRDGPNVAKLIKFSSWTSWTLMAQGSVTTDNNWHILKMELSGNNIKCYYDGSLVFDVIDSSYSQGTIDLETWAYSNAEYDWVNVTVLTPKLYYPSGVLVSRPFDAGFKANWMQICWSALTPAGTAVKFRTRTAPTEAGLSAAPWSEYYTTSGNQITSPANRWIQYEATLLTNDSLVTPILYDVTIYYASWFWWTQTSREDFEYGTLTDLDTSTVPGQVILAPSTGGATLFSDNFDDANWTTEHWTVKSGTWTVQNGEYIQNDTSSSYKNTYTGQTNWDNYVVEVKAKYVSGYYGAQVAARLDPTTGARYAFWIYPNPSYDGPNRAKLVKFSSWTSWTLMASSTSIITDNNWHVLKMELNGDNIKCYYDGNLVFDVTDSSQPYLNGAIGLETYGAEVHYDWVTVTTTKAYVSSGTLISSPFDAEFEANWLQIVWNASTPTGTMVKFRTRTAPTPEGLKSAPWSDYYTKSGASITSPANRWIQYEATLSTNDASVTPTLYDVTIYYAPQPEISTRLYFDPSTIEMATSNIGQFFNVSVKISNAKDLKGFDLNLTWDNSLITFSKCYYNDTFDAMWGSGNWFVAVGESGAGWYKLVALSTKDSFNSTDSQALFIIEFRVEDPQSNFVRETPIHFAVHKLSDSNAEPIDHTVEDGTYRISGEVPSLVMSPTSKRCRKYGETFTVEIKVSEAFNFTDFEFEIEYNTTLLDYLGIEWNAWGNGTVTVDEAGGKITGYTSGGMLSGDLTLITIEFNATFHRIWKNLPGWVNDQSGKIFIKAANISYPGDLKLRYIRGGLSEISVGPDFAYTFSPIQGDIDNNGTVEIYDLRTVAAYYDQEDETHNLTGDAIIDIYDLVVIASNYGYSYDP
jgi:hypothetical protein